MRLSLRLKKNLQTRQMSSSAQIILSRTLADTFRCEPTGHPVLGPKLRVNHVLLDPQANRTKCSIGAESHSGFWGRDDVYLH
jgi:hypothetical protein